MNFWFLNYCALTNGFKLNPSITWLNFFLFYHAQCMYLYGKGAARRLLHTLVETPMGLTINPHHQVRPKGVSTVFSAGVSKQFSWEGASIRQTPNAIPNVERTKSTPNKYQTQTNQNNSYTSAQIFKIKTHHLILVIISSTQSIHCFQLFIWIANYAFTRIYITSHTSDIVWTRLIHQQPWKL